MKKAFTLAEVLITLAVIGVVAALTIPTVVHKYQQKQMYTQFMKVYNTLQKAYQMSVVENGDIDQWAYIANCPEAFRTYFGKYIKSIKDCTDDLEECGITEDVKLKVLNGEEFEDNYAGTFERDGVLILPDGSIVAATTELSDSDRSSFIAFIVDTNGLKGPNTFGRDVFQFYLDTDTPTKKYQLYPEGLYVKESSGWVYNTVDNIVNGNGCSASGQSEGTKCGARLLLESKMNY